MLLQKPKAVSLESPAVSSLFQMTKVYFHAHYRLGGELARTMRDGEAETESSSLISLGQPVSQSASPHPSLVAAPSWLFMIWLLAG